ncbi:MAG: ornithine carbamoyltransferase [Legionellales bacterium]|nr:ornithine carbamoyltransferase [Legionellales bacterium]
MLTQPHLLTGDEFTAEELTQLLTLANQLKNDHTLHRHTLTGRHVALAFDKPSLRTRFSFTVAVQQLGGSVVESVGDSRKNEAPKDFIRVLQGYCDALMIRTFNDDFLQLMQPFAPIPIINGLTDKYHPCQTLADLLTLQQKFDNPLSDLTLCYVGDGNNVLHSLLLMAPKLGIRIHYCCPDEHEPDPSVLAQVSKHQLDHLVQAYSQPEQAVANAHAVYTDVWTSMGFSEKDPTLFAGYQVNEQLMQLATPEAIFMHCMPMNRGEEVSETLPDQPNSAVFQQSENRLHVQKAILIQLLT